MKKMRKLAGLLLAMVMVLSMTVSVFAETTYSITINNSAAGHTYEAYQIFSGTLGPNKELGDIVWGSGISTDGQTALGDAKEKAETLNDEAAAEAFIAEVSPYLTTPAGTDNSMENGKYVISGLTPGYYLVKDLDGSLDGKNDAYTEYILKVVADVTTAPKSDVPEVEKKVDDKNDSNTTEDEIVWQDSADYDIGDDVPFRLKATLANNVSAYDAYKVVFHDTLSSGLTYNEDFRVEYNGTDVTDYFTDSYDPTTGELTFTCVNVKEFGAGDSAEIYVYYTAELNQNANIGEAGNPNEVYLEYSNNPNWEVEFDENGKPEEPGNDGKDNDGDGEIDEDDEKEEPTGETPEDKVIVFTYKVVVNKVDEDEQPLEGAGFTLYKKNAEGEYEPVGAELVGDALTTFEWKGLDDGDYKLVETTTPAGYNTIEPIEFTITAAHDLLSDDPRLTELSGGNLGTGEVSTGKIETNIENKTGATLPETGGMGTTLFYVIGAALAVGAVVVMVTRKRMSAN